MIAMENDFTPVCDLSCSVFEIFAASPAQNDIFTN